MPQRRIVALAQTGPTQAQIRLPILVAGSFLVAALTLLGGCSGDETAPPQQVQSANPTVTYKYKGDQELIRADQSAEVYCSNKYHASARSTSITDAPDGGKAAVFECVQNTATPLQAPAGTVVGGAAAPGTSYSYASDQELLDRTRNAEAYCNSLGGGRHAVSTINNADGTRSVSFTCAATQP